jgi:catechol 2,3-dioxygenase-like lactoylglutathione lyase family enzyme
MAQACRIGGSMSSVAPQRSGTRHNVGVIQHVAIEVREHDLSACVRFWELLGFEAVAPPPALAARAAWLQAGPTQIHLLFADDPVVPGEGHVAVVVDAFESTCARLAAAGFEPHQRAQHWGAPRAFVRSPAGHRVEIMAFGPPVS